MKKFSTAHVGTRFVFVALVTMSVAQANDDLITRSVTQKTTAPADVDFATTVYDQANNKLYLGAAGVTEKNPQAAAVTVAQSVRQTDGANKGKDKVLLTGLATTGDLNNKKISKLALAGPDNDRKLLIVRDGDAGKKIVVQSSAGTIESAALFDAAKKPVTISGPVVAVAGTDASDPLIFAAVADGSAKGAKTTDIPGTPSKDILEKVTMDIAAKTKAAVASQLLAADALFLNSVKSLVKTKADKNIDATNPFAPVVKKNDTATAVHSAAEKAGADVDGKEVIDKAVKVLSLDKTKVTPATINFTTGKRMQNAAIVKNDPVFFTPGFQKDKALEAVADAVYAGSDSDSLHNGTAAALAGGVAWALRSGETPQVSDVASKMAIKALFKEGADQVAKKYSAAGKTIAAYAANKVTNDGPTQGAVADEVKYDQTDADTKKLALTKRVNNAVTQVQEKANINPVTMAVVTALAPTFNTTFDGATGITMNEARAKNASVESMVDAAATAAAAGGADTAAGGVETALSGMIGRAIGKFKFAGQSVGPADIVASAEGDVKGDATAITAELEKVGGALKDLPVAKHVVKAIDTDLGLAAGGGGGVGDSKISKPFFAVVEAAVKDLADGRIPQAAVNAFTATQNAGGDLDKAIAKAAVGSTAATFKDLIKQNDMQNVAGQATIANAVNAVNDLAKAGGGPLGGNKAADGSAAALIGTLGWGIRAGQNDSMGTPDTAIVDTNAGTVDTEIVKPMLGALAAAPNLMMAGNATALKAITDLNNAGDKNADAARTAIATAIITAVKAGRGTAVANAFTAVNTNAKTLVAKVQTSAGGDVTAIKNVITSDQIKDVAAKPTRPQAVAVVDALVMPAGALKDNNKNNGPAAALIGTLGWGIANPFEVINKNAAYIDLILVKPLLTDLLDKVVAPTINDTKHAKLVDAITMLNTAGGANDTARLAIADAILTAVTMGRDAALNSAFPAASTEAQLPTTVAASTGATAKDIADLITPLGKGKVEGIAKADPIAAAATIVDNLAVPGAAAGVLVAKDADAGAAAALIGALGWGVRNTLVDTSEKDIKTNFVEPMLDDLAKAANFNGNDAGAAIGQIGGAGAAKDELAKAILAAVKEGTKAAVTKANMIIGDGVAAAAKAPATDAKALKDALLAIAQGASKIEVAGANGVEDAIAAVNKFQDIAEAADATAAAGVANVNVITANKPQFGAAAAIEAALGFAARKVTMNSEEAQIKALLSDGASGVIDKLKTAAAGNSIAQAAISKLATAIQAGNEPFPALQTGIKAALAKATGDTAAFTATKLVPKSAIVTAAAAALAVDGANIDKSKFSAANLQAVANAADLNAAAVAAEGLPIADTIEAGAIASLKAALGWAIHDAIVTGGLARTWATNDVDSEGKNRGFAILQKDGANIALKDPADVTAAGTKALALNLAAKDITAADRNVAFSNLAGVDPMNYAQMLDEKVAMHWDSKLQRLYIGLNSLGRGNADDAANPTMVDEGNDKTGGVVSLLVAGVDNKKAFIKPVVVNPTNKLGTDPEQQIVGFHEDAGNKQAWLATAFAVRTMHTSTGKDYVIVNGGVADGDTKELKSWVFALPVMPAGNNNAGQLAKVDNAQDGLATLDVNKAFELLDLDIVGHESPKVDRSTTDNTGNPLVVGADPTLIGGDDADKTITDIQVVGDAVYVSLAETRAAGAGNVEAGIFQSSAIFDENGLIRAWSPWQRVAGTTDKVAGFGFNNKNAGFMWLDGDGNQTVKADAWGKSEEVAATSRKLSSELAKSFPSGVARVVNFDEKTKGFKTDEFSMAVALGNNNKIALIQTGVGAPLEPTDDFSMNDTVVVLDKTALKTIAPLTCAEVARRDDKDEGFLYVGGEKGVVKISVPWDSEAPPAAGLADLMGFGVKDFIPVAALGSDIRALAAKSPAGLFTGRIAALGLEHITTIDKDGNLTKNLPLTDQFGLDLLLTEKLAIVATTSGLFKTDDLDTLALTQIPGIDGTPVQLVLVPEHKGGLSDGNLYVLAVKGSETKVYRFNVSGTDVKPIGTPTVINLGKSRTSISTDGSVLFSSGTPDLVDMRTSDNLAAAQSITSLLNITTANPAGGTPVRDTASGGLVVAGNWGVRVNE